MFHESLVTTVYCRELTWHFTIVKEKEFLVFSACHKMKKTECEENSEKRSMIVFAHIYSNGSDKRLNIFVKSGEGEVQGRQPG